jgi:hypothetical protein
LLLVLLIPLLFEYLSIQINCIPNLKNKPWNYKNYWWDSNHIKEFHSRMIPYFIHKQVILSSKLFRKTIFILLTVSFLSLFCSSFKFANCVQLTWNTIKTKCIWRLFGLLWLHFLNGRLLNLIWRKYFVTHMFTKLSWILHYISNLWTN